MRSSLTILVVDDEKPIRDALVRALKQRGHVVEAASNGQVALRFIKDSRRDLDIVVSDYQMPGLDGLSFLQLVRMQRPAVTRILLSGAINTDLAIRALNEQAAHRLLRKPWNRVELDEILQICRRARSDS